MHTCAFGFWMVDIIMHVEVLRNSIDKTLVGMSLWCCLNLLGSCLFVKFGFLVHKGFGGDQ